MDKRLVWLGAGIGSFVGAYLPNLWGDHDFLSPASLVLSIIGAIAGIILTAKLVRSMG